ncbi:hypothetical protein WDV91_07880 [Curtobacterium flaccumfaciens pv. flaccumfaciens]
MRGDPDVVAAELGVQDVLAPDHADPGTSVDARLREPVGDERLGCGGTVAGCRPPDHDDPDPPAEAVAERQGDGQGGLHPGEGGTFAEFVDHEHHLGIAVHGADAGERQARLHQAVERARAQRRTIAFPPSHTDVDPGHRPAESLTDVVAVVAVACVPLVHPDEVAHEAPCLLEVHQPSRYWASAFGSVGSDPS